MSDLSFKERLQYLIDTNFINDLDIHYTNEIAINGFLFNKCDEHIIDEKGTRLINFYILQIHPNGHYNFYKCVSYTYNVIESIKSCDRVSFINCEGKIIYRGNGLYEMQVNACVVSHTFPDLALGEYFNRTPKYK